MTDGNTQAIAKHLDEREDYDALQEVTVELEQAESDNILLIVRIEELEAQVEGCLAVIATERAEVLALRRKLEEEREATWKLLETPYKLAFEVCQEKLAKAVGFIQNSALRAMIEEHDEDERDMIDFDSLRFERDCDIVQARSTLAELKGETDE